MKFDLKMLIFILFIIALVWINSRYKNIVIRGYNYVSQLPKIVMVGIAILAVCAPFMLKNNSMIDLFKDQLPESMTKNIDRAYTLKNMMSSQQKQYEQQQQQPQQQTQFSKRRGGNFTTKSVRKVSDQVKKQVAADQEWNCAICGERLKASYEVDHIVALEDGGSNNIDNLRAVCRNCHGDKTVNENIKRRYPGGWIQ